MVCLFGQDFLFHVEVLVEFGLGLQCFRDRQKLCLFDVVLVVFSKYLDQLGYPNDERLRIGLPHHRNFHLQETVSSLTSSWLVSSELVSLSSASSEWVAPDLIGLIRFQ